MSMSIPNRPEDGRRRSRSRASRRDAATHIALALAALVTLAVFVAPAGAKPRGTNGQIVFGRFDPLLDGKVLYTVNPDGSHERQLLSLPFDCAAWSPDGTQIATCGGPDGSSSALIDPDDGSYRELFSPDPTLFLACSVWSPDAKRLACETYEKPLDPTRDGIYSIRSSDGGGLAGITSNPDGHDNPGDYSPNGKRLVFARSDQDGDPIALYSAEVDGGGVRQLTPAGTLFSSPGDWSPQRNEIVFSQHVTPDARSSIWVVHADGTGLHEIPVQAQPACGGAYSEPSSQGCFGPRWSPDARKIVFARGTYGDTDSNIYTVNADGTNLTQVTHGGRDQAPDWGTHPLAD
jgi:Tol biopolymer transport system component